MEAISAREMSEGEVAATEATGVPICLEAAAAVTVPPVATARAANQGRYFLILLTEQTTPLR
jgi:hypothetical protein